TTTTTNNNTLSGCFSSTVTTVCQDPKPDPKQQPKFGNNWHHQNMAKILGLFLAVFIVALMIATTETSGDTDDKEVSRMENLFELYYFGFEFLRLVSKDMHKLALHGFGAKFQEYSREYYDLGLDVLDIANKHNMVFDFNEIANILDTVQDEKLHRNMNNYKKTLQDTPICRIKRIENRLKKILNWIEKYEKKADNKAMVIPILEHIPMECNKVKDLENKISDLIKNGDSVTPDVSLEFLYKFNTRYLLKNIQNLKNNKDVHIKYKMKQLFLTHLFHRSKEILDLRKKLGRGDLLLQFFMDKALRGSKAKYQEFYKS
ncbi:uncharacterized protein LOC115219182, partial [Argonauta hians]